MTSVYHWLQIAALGIAVLLYGFAWFFRRDRPKALGFVIAGALALFASSMVQFAQLGPTASLQADRDKLDVRIAGVKAKFEALQKEIADDKTPPSPEVKKSREERRVGIQNELNEMQKELNRIRAQ